MRVKSYTNNYTQHIINYMQDACVPLLLVLGATLIDSTKISHLNELVTMWNELMCFESFALRTMELIFLCFILSI